MEAWHHAIPWQDLPSDNVGISALLNWGRQSMYSFIEQEFGDDPIIVETVEQSFLEVAESIPMWQWINDVIAVQNRREPATNVAQMPAPIPAAPRRDMETFVDMLNLQDQLLDPFVPVPTHVEHTNDLPILVDSNGNRSLLILFSGRRREGDCVTWAKRFSDELYQHCGVYIQILSIDTAVHTTLGDLDNGRNMRLLLQIAAKRIFAAALSGPPCETWSSARHLVLEGQAHCPRPLRDANRPWGLMRRTLRELRQVATGSRLMLNATKVEILVVAGDGTSLKEHPEMPRDESMASTWRTKLHRRLVMSTRSAAEHHIQQWQFGADCVKPTRLCALGMSRWSTWKTLQEYQLPKARYPKSRLGGIAADGSFRTAAAKEYPEQLCRGLLGVIVDDAKRRMFFWLAKLAIAKNF